jgi:hypothetical protein
MTGGVCFATRSEGEYFFFDIDVKGGEKISFEYRGESSPNGRMQRRIGSECKCCHQCQRGRLLANSVNRQRMLAIDGNSEDDRQTEDKVQRGD